MDIIKKQEALKQEARRISKENYQDKSLNERDLHVLVLALSQRIDYIASVLQSSKDLDKYWGRELQMATDAELKIKNTLAGKRCKYIRVDGHSSPITSGRITLNTL